MGLLATPMDGRYCGVHSVSALRMRQYRFIAASTVGVAAGIEGYVSLGPGFGLVCAVVAFTIALAIFDTFHDLGSG